eukprot:scaffold321958_cov31-Tisochrysis_lutea.AAC.2
MQGSCVAWRRLRVRTSARAPQQGNYVASWCEAWPRLWLDGTFDAMVSRPIREHLRAPQASTAHYSYDKSQLHRQVPAPPNLSRLASLVFVPWPFRAHAFVWVLSGQPPRTLDAVL